MALFVCHCCHCSYVLLVPIQQLLLLLQLATTSGPYNYHYYCNNVLLLL